MFADAIVIVAPMVEQAMSVSLRVVVSATGAVTVDGRPVKDDNELTDRARDAIRRVPDIRALIQADKTVVYGRVVAVMEALKRGGVTKIAFDVTPP